MKTIAKYLEIIFMIAKFFKEKLKRFKKEN